MKTPIEILETKMANKYLQKEPAWITVDILDAMVEYANQQVKNNLVQPDVSGNEANPLSENKNAGEVAVCDHLWRWYPDRPDDEKCQRCGLVREWKQT